MPDGFITATCARCNRGYNVANPLVELRDQHAVCPHCGQPTEVDPETIVRARASREAGCKSRGSGPERPR